LSGPVGPITDRGTCMSYEGNDLGYDLGYDSESVSRPQKSVQKVSHPEIPQITYFMQVPGAGAAQRSGGGANRSQDSTPSKLEIREEGNKFVVYKDGKKTGKTYATFEGAMHDNPQASVVGDKPAAKEPPAGSDKKLNKLENSRKNQPTVYQSLPELSPMEIKADKILWDKGIKDPKVRSEYLKLNPPPEKATHEKTQEYFDALRSKDQEAIKKDMAWMVVSKRAKELRDQGVSVEAAYHNMMAHGIIGSGTDIPPDWPPRKKPAIDRNKIVFSDKMTAESVAYSSAELRNTPKLKGNTPTEKDASLRRNTTQTQIRRRWISAMKREYEISREESIRILDQMGFGSDKDFDPEVAAHKLFITKNEGENLLLDFKDPKKKSRRGEVLLQTKDNVTALPPNVILPGQKMEIPLHSDTAQAYIKHNGFKGVKGSNEAGQAALGIAKSAKSEQGIMALGTAGGPEGLGLDKHIWSGIISSDVYGSPPLFDADGNLTEHGRNNPQKVQAMEKKIRAELKEIYKAKYQFDANDRPIPNEGTENKVVDGKVKTVKTGRPGDPKVVGYKLQSGVKKGEEPEEVASNRKLWVSENYPKALKFHRERLHLQLKELINDKQTGEKPKLGIPHVGQWMEGQGFLSNKPDISKMSKFTEKLKKVNAMKDGPAKDAAQKALRDEIRSFNAKDGSAVPDGDPVYEEFKQLATVDKAGKKGKAGAKGSKTDPMLQQQREHAHQDKRDKMNREHQEKMARVQAEINERMKIKEEKRRESQEKKLIDYREEKAKERAKIQLGLDKERAEHQAGLQLLSQMTMAFLNNTLQLGQMAFRAQMQATGAEVAAGRQTLAAVFGKLYAPGGGGRRGFA